MDPLQADEVIAATRRWVERAVIGLKLCPFAESVHASGLIRYQVSEQRTARALLQELAAELTFLAAAEPEVWETTLLIHPHVLTDFLEYNDFLEACDTMVLDLGLEGELQVASFHPNYQFADTSSQDIDNYTNRSPYPTLHLLREASVERAVAGMLDPSEIFKRNIRTLRNLGHEGWRKLMAE